MFQTEFEATSIREGVAQLARLDPGWRVFGASGHRYKLIEPASPTTVLEIEQTSRFELLSVVSGCQWGSSI